MIEIDYQSGGIVSKQLLKTPTGNITLFAFDAGQGLTEHTSPFDALITVLEGEADVSIGGTAHTVKAGELLQLPANIPHGVQAARRFKMTLTMLKS
ncbi:MAG: cupin domain-containing protein [Acidobacteria bacterium]|nr:MAG: cupin domain-containing protein [Acidobacteriota bacterium]